MYERSFYKEYDYSKLKTIKTEKRTRRNCNHEIYSKSFIMLDTETSKKYSNKIDVNYIVAFSISIRSNDENICTLYGNKPSECIECLNNIKNNLNAEKVIIYIHNLSYDWVFLRQFMFSEYGLPVRQLNTKSHYPIIIEFNNGIILRDSLILAQRKLEKWAIDMDVEHKKAVGKWDYDKIRLQSEVFNNDELDYIECDTLAGVECLDSLKNMLKKHTYSMPFTATGIPREELRKISFNNHGKDWFNRVAPNYDVYKKLEKVYHGGYTHANRHYVGNVITDLIQCYDFSSSYPYCLLSEKYPCEKFNYTDNDININRIIKDSDNFAFIFKFCAIGIKIKDEVSMPCLQYSKTLKTVNAIIDNGRILYADYVEIYINEQDAITIVEQYNYFKHICSDVMYSRKDYLPRWLTDYVYKLYENKTRYKGGDKILYNLEKAKLNSVYGMCVQKCVKEIIEENYKTGEYIINKFDNSENNEEELYNKYLESRNSYLPYFIGVWCTSYAQKNLFELGKLCENWLYSDTDSCYGTGWDINKVNSYNDNCKNKLIKNGYSCVYHNDREYWLGIAEHEELKDDYTEFITMGAKRYCGRCKDDNKLHITVAGVPKKGSECLNDDINNFRKGTIFTGKITGKKTHTYIYHDFFIDEKGNEIADSIDLSPCDYLLDIIDVNDQWESLINEEVNIQVYE